MVVMTGSVSVSRGNMGEIKGDLHIVELYDDYLQAPSNTEKNESLWTLIWHDEFQNESSLKNWNLQDWASNKNGELQYYSPENIKVKNDLLIIESKKETYKKREYTSGALTTENILEFSYGKVEIKAKIPEGKGIFPAFWLVNSKGKDWLPEIDIMENLGQQPNELYFVVHWKDSNGQRMRDFHHYISESIDFSESFHIYEVIWEKGKITWLVDGQLLYETEEFSPNNPLYLYLNTAVGGVWPGDPNPLDEYPKELQVDYIRIYQKTGGG